MAHFLWKLLPNLSQESQDLQENITLFIDFVEKKPPKTAELKSRQRRKTKL